MELLDWKNPDYTKVFRDRAKALERIRAEPSAEDYLRQYYKASPAQFIIDWGVTVNPKNVERGLPSVIPFILYPKQAEWVNWLVEHWRGRRPGLTEKTRQMGFSWLSVAAACTLCLFNEGMVIGFGSRKQEYVDVIGDPKSLFQKAREFMRYLPPEFRGGWTPECAPHMRIKFPESGALITGEAGDNIGRGNTTSIYFVDEAAFLERPHLVDASLSQTTNCRIDISTPNGMANPFAQKRFSGKVDVFSFHWRDDPTKDDVWYAHQLEVLDPVTIGQELNIDYAASVEGVVIPNDWIRASVDAHVKLGVKPTGARRASLDVADEGTDKNALCGAQGIVVDCVEEWSGLGSDIFKTTERAFVICDSHEYDSFRYDADGLGAGVRGDANVINERRQAQGTRQIEASPFRGSAAVVDPLKEVVKGRKNEDLFANLKAQGWWYLRLRFQATYRAIVEGHEYDADEIISLSSGLSNLQNIITELSQPTYSINGAGKFLIDKAPDGVKSPNLGDSIMIRFAPGEKKQLKVSAHMLANLHRL